MNNSQSQSSSATNNSRASQQQQQEHADVCVIGSGAGGAVVAKVLAEAGLSVVILEAGENHDPSTFGSYEPEMLRRLFWDSGLRRTRDGAIVISQGRGVGGSTVHNLCYAVRPPQVLLERWGVPDLAANFKRVEQTPRRYTDTRNRCKPIKRCYPPRIRIDEMARHRPTTQSGCLPGMRFTVSFWVSSLQINSKRVNENGQAEHGGYVYPFGTCRRCSTL